MPILDSSSEQSPGGASPPRRCIDTDEMRRVLSYMGFHAGDDVLASLVAAVDTDGAGELDFVEFSGAMLASYSTGRTFSANYTKNTPMHYKARKNTL